VVLSPIATDRTPDEILKGWDLIFNSKKSRLNSTILQIEEDNRSKFGPRSIAVPWKDRASGVQSYFGPEISDKVPPQAPDNPRLRPISLQSGVKLLKNSTNSGLPFVTRKGDIKDELLKDFDNLLDRKDPCILFTRTQEQKKTRNVWGYPAADTLNEMLFYKPLLEYQRSLTWRAALSDPEKVDMSVTSMIRSCILRRKDLVSIDFSSYDASVKTRLQRSAFNYISGLFQKQYSDDIDKLATRFNTIELITPDGVQEGRHGVPSGSTFTNEVDSIAQYLCARDFGLSDHEMQIQGDDGLYIVSDSKSFIKHMQSFGLNVNDSKSLVSQTECTFLQNYYSLQYLRNNNIIGGIYSTYRALTRIVYPERFIQISESEVSGSDYFAIRTISILENVKYHPLFQDLVEYIYKLDKFNLAFSDKGLANYVKEISETTGTEGIFNYRYGDDVKGIKSFETYKLLLKLESGLI
jgi:hypothetical protein